MSLIINVWLINLMKVNSENFLELFLLENEKKSLSLSVSFSRSFPLSLSVSSFGSFFLSLFFALFFRLSASFYLFRSFSFYQSWKNDSRHKKFFKRFRKLAVPDFLKRVKMRLLICRLIYGVILISLLLNFDLLLSLPFPRFILLPFSRSPHAKKKIFVLRHVSCKNLNFLNVKHGTK